MIQEQPMILLAGHASIDIYPELSSTTNSFSSFQPGALIHVENVRFSVGGAVLNTGIALHRLGMSVRLSVRIGKDPYGVILRDLIEKQLNQESGCPYSKSECEFIESDDVTSSVIVLNPMNTDRMFLYCPGTNRSFDICDVQGLSLNGIQLFHFGYPSLLERMYMDDGRSLLTLFKELRNKGIIVSLDLSMPDLHSPAGKVQWDEFLKRVLPEVDIFMPSIEEIMFMMYRSRYEEIKSCTHSFNDGVTEQDLETISKNILALGVRIVGIKLGSDGLYVRTSSVDTHVYNDFLLPDWWSNKLELSWSNRELIVPCFKVNTIGTTGAGDSTIAGFLCGLIQNMSIEETMKFAVGVGACCVEELDSITGIPQMEKVNQRIVDGWDRLLTTLELPGWVMDDYLYQSPRDRLYVK
ncbi:MAG: carbohydrate kinase family protein [Acidibacillus sp.]|nr:carbohydrate kinase family protein [Acidibacillus sp.]